MAEKAANAAPKQSSRTAQRSESKRSKAKRSTSELSEHGEGHVGAVLGLQQRAGNRAVGRMMSAPVGRVGGIHLGPVHDRFEHEADRVARIVADRLESSSSTGSVAVRGTPPPIGAVQRAPGPAPSSQGGGKALGKAIGRFHGRGRAMSAPVLGAMEGAFGHRFGGVRLHTDAAADRLTRSVGARAMTTGKDVFFRHGEYRPETRGGRMLLAHELTHVLQQKGNPKGYVQRKIGFEFQSVGASRNVKVSQVTPVGADTVEETDQFRYVGRSSEEVLVGSFSADKGRWISDSGDLELVTNAVDESEEGKVLMRKQARNARASLAGMAKNARQITLVGAPVRGGSPGKARRKLKRSKFATEASKLAGLKLRTPMGVVSPGQRESTEWATVLPPPRGKRNAIAVRWMDFKDRTDEISFAPQMSMGVTLENMGRFISTQITEPDDVDNPFRDVLSYGAGRKEMVAQLGLIDTWIGQEAEKRKADLSGLAGILKVVGAIVVNARLRHSAGKGADYVKDLAPWMHRTSLGDAFQLLSDEEKAAMNDFRKAGILEQVGTWADSHGTWRMPELGKMASRVAAAGKTTERILSEIMAGKDPFNAIEDIGIGEIVDSHAPVLQKYRIDRSTSIGDGVEGKDRMGMIVEVRRLGAGRVTAKNLDRFVNSVMTTVLSDRWRGDHIERTRPDRKKKAPDVKAPMPTLDTSSSTGSLASTAPPPMAPRLDDIKRGRAPLAPTPEEVKRLHGSVPLPKAPDTLSKTKGPKKKDVDKETRRLMLLRKKLGRGKSLRMDVDNLVINGRPRWFVPLPSVRSIPHGKLQRIVKGTEDDVWPTPRPVEPKGTESKDSGTKVTEKKKVVETKVTESGVAPPRRRRRHRSVLEMSRVVREHEDILFGAPAVDDPTYSEWMRTFEFQVEAAVRDVWSSAGFEGQAAIRAAWYAGELGRCRLDTILGWPHR